jgi:hypothetical protein
MTPAACRTKRRQLLAEARKAENKGNDPFARNVASRCRILAANLYLAASAGNNIERDRALALYRANSIDFDRYVREQAGLAAHREGAGQ